MRTKEIDPEEIEQLQRDLYSYNFHLKELQKNFIRPINEINDELTGMNRKFTSPMGSSRTGGYHEKKNLLITRRDELENKMKSNEDYLFVQRIEKMLSCLPDSDKDLVYDKFRNNMSYLEMSKIYYKGTSTLKDNIRTIIRKMIRYKNSRQ